MAGLTALLPEKMPWLNVFLGKLPRDAEICNDQKVLSSSKANSQFRLNQSSRPYTNQMVAMCGRSSTNGEYWWIIVAQSE